MEHILTPAKPLSQVQNGWKRVDNSPEVRKQFDRCWPWFNDAIAADGKTHGKEDLWKLVSQKKVLFFWQDKSAAICTLSYAPTGIKTLNIWLYGGAPPDFRLYLIPRIEAWARKAACHRMLIYDRYGCLQANYGWIPQGIRRVKALLSEKNTIKELQIEGYSQLVGSKVLQ
jgi:hypothetical protein